MKHGRSIEIVIPRGLHFKELTASGRVSRKRRTGFWPTWKNQKTVRVKDLVQQEYDKQSLLVDDRTSWSKLSAYQRHSLAVKIEEATKGLPPPLPNQR